MFEIQEGELNKCFAERQNNSKFSMRGTTSHQFLLIVNGCINFKFYNNCLNFQYCKRMSDVSFIDDYRRKPHNYEWFVFDPAKPSTQLLE